MARTSLICFIRGVEKKTEDLKVRCSATLKKALLKIAHENSSDLSKVIIDALEDFVTRAKGKKIFRKLVLRKK
jgi:hypothetical protein